MSEEIILSCGFQRLRIPAKIGVYESELLQEQILEISLTLVYPADAAHLVTKQDDIAGAMDYAHAAQVVREICTQRHHGLLEYLAGRLMEALRGEFPGSREIHLVIDKPEALADAQTSRVELTWRL